MLKLHELKPAEGSKSPKLRKGRGTATGQGKTAGRGQDGQKSRSGGKVRVGFEGGQMPLARRIPKRGFTNKRFKSEYAIVNVEQLNIFKKGSEVNEAVLVQAGMVKNKYDGIKILGRGELNVPLTVVANKISKSALEKIEAAGGKAEVV